MTSPSITQFPTVYTILSNKYLIRLPGYRIHVTAQNVVTCIQSTGGGAATRVESNIYRKGQPLSLSHRPTVLPSHCIQRRRG